MKKDLTILVLRSFLGGPFNRMIKNFWIAVDVLVIISTIITCFFMNKQFSWWIRVLVPSLLISVMVVHIAYISGQINFFLFPAIFHNIS